MGGQEGSRGYLLQAISAVLKSIREDNWRMVQMEPKTAEDKVDILFEYEDKRRKVIQVKSSINNFTKPQIVNWYKKMINDVSDAEIYELILIGTCSDDTKNYINCIKKLHEGNLDKSTIEVSKELDSEVGEFKTKLEITLLNNDIGSFNANISLEFMKYLNNKGYGVDSDTLELIVGAINFQFGVFSTDGSFIEKEKFEDRILAWINVCYPKLSTQIKRKTSLSVQFYDKGQFGKELPKVQTNIINSKFVESKLTELKATYKKITEFNVTTVKINKTDQPSTGLLLGDKNVFLGNGTELLAKYINPLDRKLDMKTSVRVPESLKKYVIDMCSSYLGVSISEDSFFSLGNLEESTLPRPILPGFSSSKELYGSEQEKEKYYAINDLYLKLVEFEGFLKMFKQIDSLKLLPLVLRNEGDQYDEKIKVQLIIPKNVTVLDSSNILMPTDEIIEEFTEKSGIMYSIFAPKEDSNVNGYNYNYMYQYVPPLPFKTHEDDVRENRKKFRNTINSLFDFKTYDNVHDKIVLEFEFDELKAKESIHFPVRIGVETDDDFEINYKVSSKQLSNLETGTLKYFVNC